MFDTVEGALIGGLGSVAAAIPAVFAFVLARDQATGHSPNRRYVAVLGGLVAVFFVVALSGGNILAGLAYMSVIIGLPALLGLAEGRRPRSHWVLPPLENSDRFR